MKINAKELKEFLSRIHINDLITEVPVKIQNESFSILTMDENKQIVIKAAINLYEPFDSLIEFSIPNLGRFLELLSEFSNETELNLKDDYLSLSDSDKELKFEIKKTNFWSGIDSVVTFPATDPKKAFIRSVEYLYDDFIEFNGKVMKGYMDKALILKTSFFEVFQKNSELEIYGEDKKKNESYRIKLDLKSCFKHDKEFWLNGFMFHVFKKNPGMMKLYVIDKNQPMYLEIIPETSSYSSIQFLIAPK